MSKHLSGYRVSGPRYDPRVFEIRITSVAHSSAMFHVWRHKTTARSRRQHNRRKQDTALFTHLGDSGLWRGTAALDTQDSGTQKVSRHRRQTRTCVNKRFNYASVDMNQLNDKPSWTLQLARASSDVMRTQLTTPSFLTSNKPASNIKCTNYTQKYLFFARDMVGFLENITTYRKR